MVGRAGFGIGLASALLTLSGASAQVGAQPRDMVLEGGTLIDGTGRAPLADAVIVVENGRIKAVGKRGQVAIPAGAQIINASGRTILPGLIDSHVHLQEYDVPFFLHYGVTTIADINNDTDWIIAERDAIKNGKMKGPRMFVAGAFIWGAITPREENFNTPPARTVEEARQFARDRVAAGVDIVKIDNGLTDEQLRAAIEVANAAGLPTMGHTRNILRATEMGIKHEEHMDTMARALLDPDEKMSPKNYLSNTGPIEPPQVSPESQINPKQFPPLIKYMVSQGVFVNPTLTLAWSWSTPRGAQYHAKEAEVVKDPGLGFMPAEVRAYWAGPPRLGMDRPVWKKPRDGYANVAEFLREYRKAGGKIVVGSDTGTCQVVPGLGVHQEMQMLTDLGIPNMQAIQAATLWNAQLLKKDKELGSVEVGKLADFTIVQGNPLADITATQNIRMVIKQGQVMDTAYDPHWVNAVPQPYTGGTPVVTSIKPRMARQDGASTTITLEGTHFAPGAVVHFDEAALPTKALGKTTLSATLDAKLLQRNPGTYVLYVVNPGVHGTVSAANYFVVNTRP